MILFQLALSGGKLGTTYYISGNYFNQEGTIIGSGLKRKTIRINLDNQVKPWLKLGVNGTFGNTAQTITLTNNSNNNYGNVIAMAIQQSPDGLAQAFIIGESFIGADCCALVLGDNIFYGHDFHLVLGNASKRKEGASIFVYHVLDPHRYGVAEFDDQRKVLSIEEKPAKPKSNYAVTGLYFYDCRVSELAKSLTPSARGELEITDLNRLYLDQDKLHVEIMGRGYAWLDTGTHESLLDASQFIATLENRQGLKVACPEEIAYRQEWIDAKQLQMLAEPLAKNGYGQYLLRVLKETVF